MKCFLSGPALEKVEHHLIGEVLQHHRVRVIGVIHYRGLGKIDYVEALDIEFPKPRSELPNANDILEENFTGGLRTEEYLERLRNGSLC